MEKQYQPERYLKIMEIIRSEKTVRVENLASRLSVSENTIRRDLNNLAEKRMIQRTKGGAIDISNELPKNNLDVRLDKNRDCKEMIAVEAVKQIQRGDIIILDGGTTSIKLAEKIREMMHITVLTNSLDVANILSNSSRITLVLSGGIFNPDSRTMTGIPAEKFFTDIYANKLFLAVTGISPEQGLSDQNMFETPVKLKMIEAAAEIIVLADHSKFQKTSFSPIGSLDIVQKIITDKAPDAETVKKIETTGVQLITCTK